eukprot:CAMPEP_0197049820 /NCGR_PEP_ID=MMETSP1384-20130603/24867_1 /TAXON_ID=29189 /ORGANISM="Ammonia sp." /LENGTH=267 /DNA_ID=CAMNT_0042482155 /DNA_START=27 /DNA_END=828 /DNA_ORIENTATION=-
MSFVSILLILSALVVIHSGHQNEDLQAITDSTELQLHEYQPVGKAQRLLLSSSSDDDTDTDTGDDSDSGDSDDTDTDTDTDTEDSDSADSDSGDSDDDSDTAVEADDTGDENAGLVVSENVDASANQFTAESARKKTRAALSSSIVALVLIVIGIAIIYFAKKSPDSHKLVNTADVNDGVVVVTEQPVGTEGYEDDESDTDDDDEEDSEQSEDGVETTADQEGDAEELPSFITSSDRLTKIYKVVKSLRVDSDLMVGSDPLGIPFND